MGAKAIVVRSGRNGAYSREIRELLLTALHFGRFEPGDRAPSVRRMAMLTGLNRTTVHRAYRRMAADGLLAVRRGSGTYFTEPGEAGGSAPAADALVAALDRFHGQAQGLGLSDRAFARFVTLFHEPGLRRFPVAVCECNREQCGMIAREVAEATGAPTRQVLLADLCARPEAAVGAIGAVVTTDCHREEVTQALRGLRLPVHRIALERAFTDELVHHAQRGRVVMIVSDARYGPIFARTLGQLSVAARVIENFSVVEPAGLAAVVRALDGAGALYVSPLVQIAVGPHQRNGLRVIRPGRYVSEASLTRLKAQLVLDLAASS